ncbi:hypothetical protein [Saccharomonospora saliphila]|uniref:hypothetical protein n=1 Tax=Saccharomonospora saliphila TaxID=369829 RepID=UPI0003A362B9|nr:hypothetical protein [Saccharomonospora saliphila]
MRKRSATTVGATLAAAALSMVLTPAASADPVYGYEIDYGTTGGSRGDCVRIFTDRMSMCFQDYGDVFWVKDDWADGRSAVVRWKNYRDGILYREGECRNSSGAGTWVKCNKNFYEGSDIWYQGGFRDLDAGGGFIDELGSYTATA